MPLFDLNILRPRQGRYVFYSANFELMRDFIAFIVQDCCSNQQVQIQQPGTSAGQVIVWLLY